MIMRFINLPGIARNSALILGLAVMTVLSVHAQNSNTGNSSSQMMAHNSNMAAANTARVESTATPWSTATSTPRTEVKTVVEDKFEFPWGLLGLLGLAGLIPKKRSVEVSGVHDETRETRTTSDNRDNKS